MYTYESTVLHSPALVTVHKTFVFTRTDTTKRSIPVKESVETALGEAILELTREGREEIRIVDARVTGPHEEDAEVDDVDDAMP